MMNCTGLGWFANGRYSMLPEVWANRTYLMIMVDTSFVRAVRCAGIIALRSP
jgi:hypothetical protein